LSGTYTIDPSLPSSGNNFNSLSHAIEILNCIGISASVVLDVVPNSGPHITGFEIGAISGTSASNTITLNGNGNEFHEGTANSFIHFNGAEYWTINNCNFVAQNETGGNFYGILFQNQSRYINLTNNTINLGI